MLRFLFLDLQGLVYSRVTSIVTGDIIELSLRPSLQHLKCSFWLIQRNHMSSAVNLLRNLNVSTTKNNNSMDVKIELFVYL